MASARERGAAPSIAATRRRRSTRPSAAADVLAAQARRRTPRARRAARTALREAQARSNEQRGAVAERAAADPGARPPRARGVDEQAAPGRARGASAWSANEKGLARPIEPARLDAAAARRRRRRGAAPGRRCARSHELAGARAGARRGARARCRTAVNDEGRTPRRPRARASTRCRRCRRRCRSRASSSPGSASTASTALPGLWTRIHIEPGWETALEAALRERLGALEVGRLDTVRAFAADAPPARLAFYTRADAARSRARTRPCRASPTCCASATPA